MSAAIGSITERKMNSKVQSAVEAIGINTEKKSDFKSFYTF